MHTRCKIAIRTWSDQIGDFVLHFNQLLSEPPNNPFGSPILLDWDTSIVNDKDMHPQYYDKLIGKGSEFTLVIFFMIAFEKVLTSKP
jgi:hypothetical protein